MAEPIRQAIVLAGGKGTRLGDLTTRTPKPLLPVGGRPFIEWVIDNIGLQGVTDIVLTVGYRAEAFELWLKGWHGHPQVTLFVEEEPLDTGGALSQMQGALDSRFFVLNGDTLFDTPLLPLAGRLGAGPDAAHLPAAAIALRLVPDPARYGSVRLRDDVVTDFAEKRESGVGLINGGVYAFRREAFEGRVAPFSIERDLLPVLVEAGRLVGLPSNGFFIDIGVPEAFEEAQTSVPGWWARKSGV